MKVRSSALIFQYLVPYRFLKDIKVAAYVFLLVFPSLLPFLQRRALEGSS